ncbi:MAG: hypothetical protein OHK93_002740 [Ramalina farinacea]|uniref:Uncharacterized protein n=1 Tax=Ramalina farinacea TaxID=258253 RepID=A0AA43QUL6_9LECA|nr:hypothetical protein [Ramalina farinacea]
MPLASVQQLVLMSCRIEALAVSFFNTYLTRFNRIEVESMPPLTPASGNVLSQSDNPPAREKANFTPRATRFISWCEYYRVISSLWQIQLGFSTCDLSKMKSLWSKMVAEADRLIRYTQLTDKRAPWEQDTIACVKEFLEEEERTLMNTSLKHLQNESENFTTPTQSQFILPLIASPSPDPSRLENSESGSVQHGSSAYIWFTGNSAWVPRELFEEKDWQHFRRLGFGIWDRKRMTCMGLMNRIVDEADPTLGAAKSSANSGRKMTPEEQAIAWKSIKFDGRYALARRENTT